MMKAFKHIILAVALLLGFAACQKEDIVVFNPEDIVSSELAGLQSSYTITPENYETTELKFMWAATDFGVSLATNYQLEFSTEESNFEYVETLASTKDTSVLISGVDIVAKLQFFKKELGLDIESAQNYVFRIKTSVPNTDEEVYSNLSSTSITAFIQRIQYPEVWLVGDYSGWWGETNEDELNLFDFKNDKNYEGIIFFNGKAQNGFKITGATNWDNGNYGLDGNAAAPEAEANSLTLINDGGSGNMQLYSKNYYKFRFNTETLALSKLMSFDSFGITGSAVNGVDLAMGFDGKFQEFVLTAELSTGDIYFRADNADNISYGAGATPGSLSEGTAGISVTAGVYEITVNINNSEELSYSLKGKAALDPSKITVPVITQKEAEIVYAKTSNDLIEWTAVDFGGQEATKVTYSIELDLKDANFTNAIALGTTDGTEFTINGQTYMDKIAELGGDAEAGADIELRVIASVETLTEKFTSSTMGFKLTIKNEVALPTEMYIQGSFAGWDWASENLKTMTPVNGTPGAFWTITYFDAATEFKFATAKAWGSDFGFPTSDIDFAEYESGGENGKITTAGYYMLVVKCEHTSDKQSFTKKILVAKPVVQLMGDTSPSAWNQDESGNFTYDETSDTWMSPAFVNAEPKAVRLFANLSAANIGGWDWWKSEFMVLEGKIAYRGNGGDQAPVQGTLGQKVKLNFKEGTGVIE